MRHPVRKNLLRACALVAAISLSACGGGGSDSQPIGQSLSFSAPASQTVGTPLALVATATSGLAASFVSTSPGVCTVSGTTASMNAVGSCSITAVQAGNGTYAAATPVTNSFAVAAGAQTITFVSPGNQTLGTAPAALVASATSGLAVSFASSTPAVCTVSGTALTLVTAGTCTLAASQAGNANYLAAAPVTQSFTVAVGLLAQTIAFTQPGSQTMGTPPAPLVATASSGLAVTFASITPAVCMASGTTLTLVSAGTCTVAASQAGNNVYAAAAAVMNSFAVVRAAQTITFTSPGNQTLGTAPLTLVASSSAGLPVALTSTTSGVCTVSGTTLTLVAAGTCNLDANQAGNTTYAPATTVTQSFSVGKAAQTINFASPGNQTLGTPPTALVATASSGLAASFASTTTGTCTVSGSTLTLVAIGTCTVDANQAGNATYSAAPTVSRSFQVVAAVLTPQTITFNSPGNQTLGITPPPLTAVASSNLPVSFTSTTTGICTVSGSTLTLLAAGTCTINANQAGNATYSAAPQVSNTFAVAAGALTAQTISFTSPGIQTLGSPPQSLVASATSGLPVSFAVPATTSVCTVSGSSLTLVAVGTCTITANQAGNSTFAAASQVTATFLVVELFANGGFETPAVLPGQIAQGWRGVNGSPATVSTTEAHTGTRSAVMAVPDPGFNGSGLVQNSVDDGGLVALDSSFWGTAPTLTFWAKGDASQTGNVNYSLRYLNSVGAILNPVVNTSFQTLINTSTWTKISKTGVVIPVGTTAVFLEMTLATGPTGIQVGPPNCGVDPSTGAPLTCDYRQARVLIDDVQLFKP